MTQSGQLAAAELELHEWQRRDDCPPQARALLIALLARRGADNDALALLHHEDADTHLPLQRLYVALLTVTEFNEAAKRRTMRLHHSFGDQSDVAAWIKYMRPPGASHIDVPPDAAVDHIAADLFETPEVIPSLVAAQKCEPDDDTIRLLRQALARIERDLADGADRSLMICRALAELALLAHDNDDARRWTHRGLRVDPTDAALALIISELDDDDRIGPPASVVLQRAVEAHPGYPDLRLAHIRRALRDGRADEARAQVDDWLRSEPLSSWAQHAEREVAA